MLPQILLFLFADSLISHSLLKYSEQGNGTKTKQERALRDNYTFVYYNLCLFVVNLEVIYIMEQQEIEEYQRQFIVQQILQDSFFRISLRQQLQTIVQNTLQKPTIAAASIPIILEEIMEHLSLILDYKVKEIFNHQHINLMDNYLKFIEDLEVMKQRLLKLETTQRLEQTVLTQLCTSHNLKYDIPNSSLDLSRQRLKHKVVVEHQNPLQISKIRHQIESIKSTLSKISTKNILKFVSENTEQIHQKIDSNYQKLYNCFQQMSTRNATVLNEQSGYSIENKYEVLQQKVLVVRQRLQGFEGIMCDRYQSNFKNVWNVITDMGVNLDRIKKELGTSKEKGKENQQKRGLVSFLNWNF